MRRLVRVLFTHRFLALARWEFLFLRLRVTNALTGRNASLKRFALSRSRPRYLNFGSGPRGKSEPNWVNIDGFPGTNVHYCVDFQRKLPMANDTFNGIFCEHVIEHFTLEEGTRICGELYRCLAEDGVLRVVVPDADFVMRSYYETPDALVARRGPRDATPMEVVNSYFRQRYEHQFLYDWATMYKMLCQAGFTDVRRAGFRSGFGPEELRIDDEKYGPESLYVEARKVSSSVLRLNRD
jgi:predicted SAM-dependent methyltransferase